MKIITYKWLCHILLISLACVILLPHPAFACSVPVFKYALAYWPSDPYEIIVFHRGPLTAEEHAIVYKLQRASWDDSFRANVTVETVDLAGSPNVIMQKLWESQSASELPWMLVKYPRFSAVSDDLWAGKFTADVVELLLDSPVRKKIARSLLDGEVAVWVLLDSGIREQDEAAASLLKDELKKMSEGLNIVIPELGEEQLGDLDQRVSFSMIRLSRDDPNEQMFIQMLLRSEWDLKDYPKPIAFPIFGRGRALYALVGDGIRAGNIEMACSFLVGWCSCQVKADNPGVDLLMSVNWHDAIDAILYEETTQLLRASEPDVIVDEGSGNLKRNILVVVSIQVLIAIIAAFAVLWRRKQRA